MKEDSADQLAWTACRYSITPRSHPPYFAKVTGANERAQTFCDCHYQRKDGRYVESFRRKSVHYRLALMKETIDSALLVRLGVLSIILLDGRFNRFLGTLYAPSKRINQRNLNLNDN